MNQHFDCIICNDFDSENPGEDYWISTKCGHLYHFLCLKAWVMDRGHPYCPMCKTKTEEGEWRKFYASSISQKSKTSTDSKINRFSPFKLPMIDETEIEHLFKIVLLGDSGTGKTAICRRFIDDQFVERMTTTIGADFCRQKVMCCGKCVEVEVWDTAGQANFRSINMQYLREAVGVIFVYSMDDAASFTSLQYWMNKVDEALPPEVVKIMVGNKCDIDPEHWRVSRENGEKIANYFGHTFFETSAKSSENIEAVFKTLTTLILESPNLVKMSDSARARKRRTIKLHKPRSRSVPGRTLASPPNLKSSPCC